MSLIKALTGTTVSSARARSTIGGFDRKQAYKLLRCVDKDGDRSVALRDFVVFVFATWTEELNRLARGQGEANDVRQRRRQLQKVHVVPAGCFIQRGWFRRILFNNAFRKGDSPTVVPTTNS